MLKATFQFGGDNQEVIVRGNELLFFDISSGMMTSVEGLKLSKSGVLKEFPDLEDDDEWRKKTIDRLKEKIRSLNTELEKMNYVKEELIKVGYEPLFLQRAGFRTQKLR